MIRTLLRFCVSMFSFLYILTAFPFILLALLLITCAETVQGHLCGWAAILLLPAPVLFWFSFFLKHPRKIRILSSLMLGSSTFLLVICYVASPIGNFPANANPQSVFTGATAFDRTSPANLVPEIDQLKLGTFVFPHLDPLIDADRAIRIRRLFLSIYRDMQTSAEFTQLGSALQYTYRDLFLADSQAGSGHWYQYIPPAFDTTNKIPVILFLHGSLGNFKGYIWVLKRVADQSHVAIVAPSFGAGNWYQPGGIETIEQARQYCLQHPRLDGNRIFLAGLSNGGTGMTRTMTAHPDAYAGFIFLSAVIEQNIIEAASFPGLQGRRLLIIHGAEDERIPRQYIDESIQYFSAQGAEVKSHFYPKEDHFLLFSEPDAICADILTWLRISNKSDSSL